MNLKPVHDLQEIRLLVEGPLTVSKLHSNQSLLCSCVSGYSVRKARRGCSISVSLVPSSRAFTVCGRTVSVRQLLPPFLMRPPFSPVAFNRLLYLLVTKILKKEGEGEKGD